MFQCADGRGRMANSSTAVMSLLSNFPTADHRQKAVDPAWPNAVAVYVMGIQHVEPNPEQRRYQQQEKADHAADA